MSRQNPPFPSHPEYMNGRLKKIDMESRLLKIFEGVSNKTWYPNWDEKERNAAKMVLHNALDVLEEFDY